MRRPLVIGVAAALVLAVVLWYLVLISPQSHHLANLRSQSAALQSTQTGLETRLAALKRAQTHQSERQATLDRYSAAIPASADMATFINQVTGLAQSSGAALRSLAPTPPAAVPPLPYSTIKITITIFGSYGATVAFLDGLYTLPRLVVVDGVTIGAGGAATPSSAGPSATPGSTAGGTPTASTGTAGPGNLQTTFTARIFTTAAPATAAP